MALRSFHRYVAETSDREGRRLGELAVAPDLAPAAEWTHFHAARRGALPALAHHGPGVVEPVYDDALGRPYVAGVRVRFDAADPAYEAPVIPGSYFHPCVESGARRLVESGTLRAGESFVYRICAYPVHRADAPARADPPDPERQGPSPLALHRVALAPRLARAQPMGGPAWSDADFPVLVQRAVLDEASTMARAAGERETGGVLVGHLRRDTDTPEIHAEITAQIPAAHSSAGSAHLGFTAETWSAVADALALRGRDEMWLGWWHYHPFFCRRCDPSRRRHCVFSRPFLSRDDRELHRTVFDTAFSVALLVSDVGDASLACDWFGWRHGAIGPRGCYVVARGGDDDQHPARERRRIARPRAEHERGAP